jgi:hypothetical protein
MVADLRHRNMFQDTLVAMDWDGKTAILIWRSPGRHP